MRWKTRVERSEPAARRPGPKKLVPVDWNRLEQDIRALRHGSKRSHGTGAVYASCSVHDLNHRPRPCLQGRNACQVFFGRATEVMLNRRARKEVIDQLFLVTAAILQPVPSPGPRDIRTAWRLAAETWLRVRGLITASTNGRVSPGSPPNLAHK